VDLRVSGKRTAGFVANGEQLDGQTYPEASDEVGREGWELVTAMPPSTLP
jgi:hypothetical protein